VRIKNWHKFQHFKDRRPPWIKLYRDLLDDPDWHDLDGEAAKVLTMLWLVASENDGELPDLKKLAFRLRIKANALDQILNQLSHWVERDDIKPMTVGYHNDTPETETETQEEAELRAVADATRTDDHFEKFWQAKPRRKGANPKADARKAFDARVREGADPGGIVEAARQWAREDADKTDTEFIPMASTWLRQKRFDDIREAQVASAESVSRATALAEAHGYRWDEGLAKYVPLNGAA
jgi:hypothetical protein